MFTPWKNKLNPTAHPFPLIHTIMTLMRPTPASSVTENCYISPESLSLPARSLRSLRSIVKGRMSSRFGDTLHYFRSPIPRPRKRTRALSPKSLYRDEGIPDIEDVEEPLPKRVRFAPGKASYHNALNTSSVHGQFVREELGCNYETAALLDDLVVWSTQYLISITFRQESHRRTHIPSSVTKHIQNLIKRILLLRAASLQSLFLSFWYLSRLAPGGLVPIGNMSGPHVTLVASRMLLLGLMLATKWMDDGCPYTNQWCAIFGMEKNYVNALEMSALRALEFQIGICDSEWRLWLSNLETTATSTNLCSNEVPAALLRCLLAESTTDKRKMTYHPLRQPDIHQVHKNLLEHFGRSAIPFPTSSPSSNPSLRLQPTIPTRPPIMTALHLPERAKWDPAVNPFFAEATRTTALAQPIWSLPQKRHSTSTIENFARPLQSQVPPSLTSHHVSLVELSQPTMKFNQLVPPL